jgi:hypothetical protein
VKKVASDGDSEIIDISGWVNSGENHVSVKTWDMDYLSSKALVREVERLAKKYPGIRFRVEAWRSGSRNDVLSRMRDQEPEDKEDD